MEKVNSAPHDSITVAVRLLWPTYNILHNVSMYSGVVRHMLVLYYEGRWAGGGRFCSAN